MIKSVQDQWVCNIGATDGYVNNGCDLQKGKDGRDTVILEIIFFSSKSNGGRACNIACGKKKRNR